MDINVIKNGYIELQCWKNTSFEWTIKTSSYYIFIDDSLISVRYLLTNKVASYDNVNDKIDF